MSDNREVYLGAGEFTPLNLTPARLREIAFKHGVTSGPGEDKTYMPTEDEIEITANALHHAVSRGQVIDFGFWPNEMIKKTSVRGGELYSQGFLPHPFTSPYVILHSWSDETNNVMGDYVATCAYLINPFTSNLLPFDFEAMELTGFRVAGMDCVSINDRVSFTFDHGTKSGICGVIPFIARFPSSLNDKEFIKQWARGQSVERAAMGNVMDPLIAALTILNTKGIPSETIEASSKLNQARKKANKPIIPSYKKVDSSFYVTALQRQEKSKGESRGGTHASPIMHLRMGHLRNYKSGEASFVRDTIVNASEEAKKSFQATRSHYQVKK